MMLSALATIAQGQSHAQGAGAEHDSLVITLVGACVGLMVIAAIVDRIAGRLKVPFTVALVVAGACLLYTSPSPRD